MPDLIHSLQGYDLGHLRIIAKLWDIEFDVQEVKAGLHLLAAHLLEGETGDGIINNLPERALVALEHLLRNGGRYPWAGFTRRYGEVREMGTGRRDREKPYDDSDTSPTEALWYRGLLGRAFFDTPSGPIEYAFIPTDLLDLMPEVETAQPASIGRPASDIERAHQVPSNDRLLEDATTLLAGLRLEMDLDQFEHFLVGYPEGENPLDPEVLRSMLLSAGILDSTGLPDPETTKTFLEAERGEALLMIMRGWVGSEEFSELLHLPNLVVEGDWRIDPRKARREILNLLSTVPGGQVVSGVSGRPWWSLRAFINGVFELYPDFMRPSGDYDSWLLRDRSSGASLRGFDHWQEVEGALIRFVICGPLHWLGVLDLAYPPEKAESEQSIASAFRFSRISKDLLDLVAPVDLSVEDKQLLVSANGRIFASKGVPRAARYQLSRFCQWDGIQQGEYIFQVSTKSLKHAAKQGLRVDQLLALLSRYAKAVPPSLSQALKRWENQGVEVKLESVLVLRVTEAELLLKLRKSRAGRFLGDLLGPTAVVVKPGAKEKVLSTLTEWGYLAEFEILEGEINPERDR